MSNVSFYCINFSSWGNMLTSALSKAVEKAMESDVEYRRGLPVNLCSFMGSGLVSTYFICFVFANCLLYEKVKQFYHSFPWTRSVVFFALVPLSPPKRLYLFSGKFYVGISINLRFFKAESLHNKDKRFITTHVTFQCAANAVFFQSYLLFSWPPTLLSLKILGQVNKINE